MSLLVIQLGFAHTPDQFTVRCKTLRTAFLTSPRCIYRLLFLAKTPRKSVAHRTLTSSHRQTLSYEP